MVFFPNMFTYSSGISIGLIAADDPMIAINVTQPDQRYQVA